MGLTKGENLTMKQKLFVANYISNGGNASKAARDAGYSQKTAHVIGLENLEKPIIKAAISKAVDSALKDLDMDKVRWLNEVRGIAFSDIRDVAIFDSSGVGFKDSEKLTDRAARAIEAVESTTTYDKEGRPTVQRKVKLYSKTKGLDTLGKFMGMLKEDPAAGVTIIINANETDVV